ncbi:MAG TPA: cytochrome oxidase [Rudaea sp.]|jgi:cytochrome c oxidase subunit 2|uniref:cytochrome oxidase n=1 Tax=Rudaea sp. TaxID=2136325 RepID=UPI002F958549
MNMQDEVWIITLIGVGLVALAFVWVIVQSARPPGPQQVHEKAHALRRWWFLALVVLGIGIACATLRPFPIADQQTNAQSAQIVDAIGRQWSWQLSRTRVDAGIPVEFDVSSGDVNHGFAIYGPDNRILAQTQAMPGFTNRLLYTFTQPGKYRVLCLEYCGLAHHNMVAEFEVVAAATGVQP